MSRSDISRALLALCRRVIDDGPPLVLEVHSVCDCIEKALDENLPPNVEPSSASNIKA